MKVKVYITLKEGVLDPQGKAVESGLKTLGFTGVGEVRVGKFMELEVDGDDVEGRVSEMCDTLLANTVIEDYKVEVQG